MSETSPISLLHPENDTRSESGSCPLSSHTVRDLCLERVARYIAYDTYRMADILRILTELSYRPATIRYRQDIFRDIHESEDLANGFEKTTPLLAELSGSFRSDRGDSNPLLQALHRLGDLETYIECITALHDLMSMHSMIIRSRGLLRLHETVERIRESEVFRVLVSELPRIRHGLKIHKSITVGINLDDDLRPVAAAILSVNASAFSGTSLISRLFPASSGEYAVSAPLHSMPGLNAGSNGTSEKLPLAPLFQDLDTILRSRSRQIITAVDRFVGVNTECFAPIAAELGFYLGAVRYAKTLALHGLPVCIPEIRPPEERTAEARGFYNILLAEKHLKETADGTLPKKIVLNDVQFGPDGRVFILTGPNRGGKTTYTQGIGILHVLAQAGLFVPARTAALSPADKIETHFPAEETGKPDLGRLGEEAARLQSIFTEITAESVVLLNESLSSTSPSEGLSIAEDLVKAFRFLGVRTVFATHLHDLAFRHEIMNRSTEGDGRIACLTAGIIESENGKNGNGHTERSYTISPGPPGGISYARDIAYEYGLSFERLAGVLQARKSNSGGILPDDMSGAEDRNGAAETGSRPG